MSEKYSSKPEQQPVDSYYLRYTSGKINIDPTFQRGSVWDDEQQSEFIESIHRGIIPNNLLFNIDEDGNYICIDGKQRIESIVKFKKNEIPLIQFDDQGNPEWNIYYSKVPEAKDDKKSKKKSKTTIQSKTFDKKERLDFDNTTVQSTVYKNLSYHDQRDIFNIIQKGSKLTQGETVTCTIPNEKLAQMFNELCNKNVGLFEKYNKIKTDRRGHFNVIANCMFIVYENKFELPGKKKREKFFASKELDTKNFKTLIVNVEAIINIALGTQMLGHNKVINDIALNIIYAACFYVHNVFGGKKNVKIDNKLTEKVIIATNKLSDMIKNNSCKTFADYYKHFKNSVDAETKDDDDSVDSSNSEDDNKSEDNKDNKDNNDDDDDKDNKKDDDSEDDKKDSNSDDDKKSKSSDSEEDKKETKKKKQTVINKNNKKPKK
jgi:hypothetical protein